jgi:hypothetical protein
VVEHRHSEQVLRPSKRIGVEALAGEEERPKSREIVLSDEFAPRVFALDRPKAVGAVKKQAILVLRDYAPERAGIRRADGLPFEQNRRAAVDERPVDDVGMPDDPADVRSRPVHLAGPDSVDVSHHPVERDEVPAVVSDDPLRLAGRARGVEDVERVRSRRPERIRGARRPAMTSSQSRSRPGMSVARSIGR